MDLRSLLDRWTRHLNAGQIEQVVALYADQATLIPTFSARTLTTSDAIRGYFDELGERPGLVASFHLATVRDQALTDSLHIVSGLYSFRFEVDDHPLTFEARFTFVVDTSQEAPILHHHSSQIPRAFG